MSVRRISSAFAVILLLGIMASPAQAQTVSPTTLDFNTVLVDDSATLSFTITNDPATGFPAFDLPISISDVQITGGGADAYSVNWSGSTIFIVPGGDYTFDVTFTPGEGISYEATLEITINDPPNMFYPTVTLTGLGEAPVVEDDPAVMIDDLIAFFEAAVSNGELEGVSWGRGRGRGWGRMAMFRVWIVWKMLHSTERLIDRGYYEWANWQLNSILKHADGAPRPHDFVKGTAQPEFASMILDLMLVLENY